MLFTKVLIDKEKAIQYYQQADSYEEEKRERKKILNFNNTKTQVFSGVGERKEVQLISENIDENISEFNENKDNNFNSKDMPESAEVASTSSRSSTFKRNGRILCQSCLSYN